MNLLNNKMFFVQILYVVLSAVLGYVGYIAYDIYRWDLSEPLKYKNHPNPLLYAVYGHTSYWDSIYAFLFGVIYNLKGYNIKGVMYYKFKKYIPFFLRRIVYFSGVNENKKNKTQSDSKDIANIDGHPFMFMDGATYYQPFCYSGFYYIAQDMKADLGIVMWNWTERKVNVKLVKYGEYRKENVLHLIQDEVDRIGLKNICLNTNNLSDLKFRVRD